MMNDLIIIFSFPVRCTCDSNFCNGDRNLAVAGLQSLPDGGSRLALTNLVASIGILISLFIAIIFHLLML
jgi:hypothetical protein